MQVNEISSVDTPNFVNDFFKDKLTTESLSQPQTPPATDTVAQFLQTTTKTEASEGTQPEDTSVEKKEGETKSVEDAFKEAAEKKELEENQAKPLVSDVRKFSETLAEKQLLYKYSDGTLPETDEELIDALSQSVTTKAQESLRNLWDNKINSFSPQVQTILKYAEMGTTSAAEIKKIVNQVSQYESVAQLDPKNPEDQEQIILIQLMNTGLSEKAAREDVADIKALNKLESKANEYFPSLKKVYEGQINQTYLEKQRAIEEEDRYVQTNATNVDFFLQNEDQVLPFKIANQGYKSAIFQLAAQPVEYTEEGEAVFGWQKYIQNLQQGDEKSYKQFMKIMAFAANTDFYEKSLSKTTSNQVNQTNFKKIMTTEGKSNNASTQEQDYTPTLQKKTSNKAWSV